jgi:26S proteasome regulatory subunit N3
VSKLLVIVQLLMGDIPERSVFVQAGLEKALLPYLNLTMVWRIYGGLGTATLLLSE